MQNFLTNSFNHIHLTKFAYSNARGFTIVELLIVIVVIGILASIIIIAYNGVSSSAKDASAQSSAETLQKKLEVYNVYGGGYPPSGAGNATTALNGYPASSITGSGLNLLAANPTSANGKNSVLLRVCTAPAGATGYQIVWYKFTTAAVVTITAGTNSTPCTTYTNAT